MTTTKTTTTAVAATNDNDDSDHDDDVTSSLVGQSSFSSNALQAQLSLYTATTTEEAAEEGKASRSGGRGVIRTT